MNKWLIVALSCLLVLSLVFGYTYIESIGFVSEKINKISDKMFDVVEFVTKTDFKEYNTITVPYKYANFGSINDFENGHIDKAQYIRDNYLPEWVDHEIDGFSVDVRFNPYYVGLIVYERNGLTDAETIIHTEVIHYEFTIIMGEEFNRLGNRKGEYTFDVYVVDKYSSYAGLYVVRLKGYDNCIVSNRFNSIDELSLSQFDEDLLNGAYKMYDDTYIGYSEISKNKIDEYHIYEDLGIRQDNFYNFIID